jgi:hypothetical protein
MEYCDCSSGVSLPKYLCLPGCGRYVGFFTVDEYVNSKDLMKMKMRSDERDVGVNISVK